MRVDVNTFIGRYPFRDAGVDGVDTLLAHLATAAVSEAWVSHLPAIFWKDPARGNAALFDACAGTEAARPVAAVHPGMPGWERHLDEALARGAVAIRCDPLFYGLDPAGADMQSLLAACAERSAALMLAVRLEDGRQRHPNDISPDLPPAAVRSLIRSHPAARLIVTHADREFVEQVHFGSTPDESSRILWDICWIWGPPEDHLALLIDTVGARHFAFGTGAPLRIADNSDVKLELLGADSETLSLITHLNAARFAAPGSR